MIMIAEYKNYVRRQNRKNHEPDEPAETGTEENAEYKEHHKSAVQLRKTE